MEKILLPSCNRICAEKIKFFYQNFISRIKMGFSIAHLKGQSHESACEIITLNYRLGLNYRQFLKKFEIAHLKATILQAGGLSMYNWLILHAKTRLQNGPRG
jgi:hypothetical protein